jgi:hypothetical protein
VKRMDREKDVDLVWNQECWSPCMYHISSVYLDVEELKNI